MSSDETNNPQTQPSGGQPARRRSSFTTSRLSEMFSQARNPQSSSPPNSPPSNNSPSFNTNVFNGNTQQQGSAGGRRMSVTTLGLSGSNGGGPMSASSAPPPSAMWGMRRGSTSTGPPSNASSEESAIDDSTDLSINGAAVSANGPSGTGRRSSGNAGNVQPGSPLGRRMSFGARAMGQMRGDGQGFNWADNLRNRQNRSGSGVGSGLMSPTRGGFNSDNMAQPPSQPTAAREPAPLPKRETPPKKPDHFQERILKGDFYMD